MRNEWWPRVSWVHAMCALTCIALLTACGRDAKPVGPGVTSVNLSLAQVIFTQSVQDENGSLPLVAGAPAAVKVRIVRSVETVKEVSVVLRLFRGSAVIHTDTTRTGGILGPSSSLASASAEFLVPGPFIAPDVAWQVALDPLQREEDSTRADNLLPASAPAMLQTVVLRPIRIRLVPVVLTQYGDVTGDVTIESAATYVRLARQLYPSREFTVSVGSPVRSAAFAGAPPQGGDRGFWLNVIGDVDQARVNARAGDEYWYGVVARPPAFEGFTFAGYAYLPTDPLSTQTGTRSAAGLGFASAGVPVAQYLVAHELGHLFGRNHAPGCGAAAPIDTLYPGESGLIFALMHDVWSWVDGSRRGAGSIGASSTDVMSYCGVPNSWISPYTYRGMLQWRAADGVVTRPAPHTGAPIALP